MQPRTPGTGARRTRSLERFISHVFDLGRQLTPTDGIVDKRPTSTRGAQHASPNQVLENTNSIGPRSAAVPTPKQQVGGRHPRVLPAGSRLQRTRVSTSPESVGLKQAA